MIDSPTFSGAGSASGGDTHVLFGQTMGYVAATPPAFASAVEDGTDPSPDDTVLMDRLCTGRKVKVLLYNAQVVSPVTQHVETVARQAHIPVVGVTETMPTSAGSYQAWQLSQAEALLRALGG